MNKSIRVLALFIIVGAMGVLIAFFIKNPVASIVPRSQVAAISGAGSGLVAHYSFDEGVGTIAGDISGNGSTGMLTNGPTWTAGKISGALSFDGSDDRVMVSSQTLPTQFTISAWLYNPANNVYETIFAIGKDRQFSISNGFLAYWNGSGSEYPFGTVPNGSWQHVVFTYDGSALRGYLNGSAIGVPLEQGTPSVSDIMAIGAWYNGSGGYEDFFSGSLDDVRVYNRALSTSEISELYSYTGGTSPTTYTLSVSKSGTGSGAISGTGINCGTDCSETVNSGTSVTLNASAASGSTFAGWSGACSGTGSCTVTLNANTNVTAAFNIVVAPPTSDSVPPSIPTNFSAAAISSSQISLSWTASTDDNSVAGYRIYRNGSQAGTSNSSSYVDSGLSASTAYSYSVLAYDASGNLSGQSSLAYATTLSSTTPPPPSGTVFYIRDGGTSSLCSDWANACNSLPSNLQRGATYYVADGSYSGRTFSTAVSGTAPITIKKATVTNHGTDAGWNSTYGDGQAAFSGQLRFTTRYWIIDGVSGGGPGSWKTGLGFKVTETSSTPVIHIDGGGNVDMSHIELQGAGDNGSAGGIGNDGFQVFGGSGPNTISYAYMHDTGRTMFYHGGGSTSAITASYIYTGKHESTSNEHSEWAVLRSTALFTVRWSVITHTEGTGGIIAGDNGQTTAEIYGNVFYNDGTSGWGTENNGLIAAFSSGSAAVNWKVYNNSFINIPSALSIYGVSGESPSGNQVRNNLYYLSTNHNPGFGWTQSFDHFVNSGSITGSSGTTGTGNPFAAYTAYDFRLINNTAAGTPLPAPYNVDALGNIRSTWTRGAYEFNGTTPPPTTYTLSVSKSGTGSGAISGTGINCGTDCSETVNSGTSVTLNASAASGSTFAGWSGACSGTGSCTVTLNANTNVTAAFNIVVAPPTTYTLSVSKSGTGTGTVTSLGGSINCGSICSASGITSGTVTTLVATPAQGSIFSGWSGACTGLGSCTITISSNVSVTASFIGEVLPPTDTTAPTVSITSPSSGTTVKGASVSLVANASDDVGVSGVQFKLNGTNLGEDLSTIPYSGIWNTLGVSDGTHTLTAVARDAAGNTKVSSGITLTVSNIVTPPGDLTPPSIPQALQATTVSSSQINLSWSSSNDDVGVSGYRIYQNGIHIGTTTGTFYQSIGLTQNTLYSYTVLAFDAVGNASAQSSAASATTLRLDNTAPIISSITSSSAPTSLTINWVTNEPSDSQIEYGLTNTYGISTPLDASLVTSHALIITGLTSDTLYYIRIKSKDASGNLALSPTLSFRTALPSVVADITPPIISGITVSNTSLDGVKISWTTNEPSTSRIDYGLSSSLGSVRLDSSLVTSHSVTLLNLARKTKYWYRITSLDAAGNSASSQILSFSTSVRSPKPPRITSLSAKSGSVILSWTPPQYEFASSIVVTRRTSSFSLSPETSVIARLSKNATGYTDVSALYNTTYYYSVFVVDDHGVPSDPQVIAFAPDRKEKSGTSLKSTGTFTPTVPQRKLSAPTSISPSTAQFTRSLSLGSKGEDVRLLQMMLNSKGYFITSSGPGSKGEETELFGPATERALKAFQCSTLAICSGSPEANGFGYAGSRTREMLRK